MKGFIRILVLMVFANGVLTGCATITRGTTEAFQVKTDPSGANVRLSSGETCKSPCTLEKKRKHNFTVFIEKPGYESTHVSVVSQVAGSGAAGMAGNIIFGGIIGAGVDAGTGATKELIPNPVEVELAPISGDAKAVSGGRSQEGEATQYTQVSRRSARGGGSPGQTDTPEAELIARLDNKVHENMQGVDYIWLDVEWENGFAKRQVEKAQGKLKITEIDSERQVQVPWGFERTLAPGEHWVSEESGFKVKNTQSLKWLLRAKTEDLQISFIPSEIAFADGSRKEF